MVLSIIVLATVGFIAGYGLMLASKKFHVEKDPLIAEISDMLPAANCGGCGYPGCGALAVALVKGEAPATACPVGGLELAEQIAAKLGIEVGMTRKLVARVKCRGGKTACPEKYDYYGPRDCYSITLLGGGNKECIHGCVGGASCVRVCNFAAIKMGSENIPVVNEKKCTACGACVKACPRKLIVLSDATKKYLVACNSVDKGAETKKICSVGCIGCKLCEKNCPSKSATVANNLATINCDTCDNKGVCREVCPTGSIVKL